MKRTYVASGILAGVAATLIGACAAVATDKLTEKSEKQFVTGSNVPVRDRAQSAAKTVDKAEFERARLAMQPNVKGD